MNPIPWIWRGMKVEIVETGRFADGTACLDVIDTNPPIDDTPNIARLTICVRGLARLLEPGELVVKTWSENEAITQALLAQGIFIDTGKRVPTGYVEASVWRTP